MRDLTKLPLVYIAGPYTHPDPVVNTREACIVATALIDSGVASALVPHPTLLWHLVTPREVDYWYALDLSHLHRCDALYRIAGESSGADAEVAFAVEHSIPVFYETDDGWFRLQDWCGRFEANR